MQKVNGWNNRETWLVSLWFSGDFDAMREDGIELTPDNIREHVESYLDQLLGEHATTGFVADMMHMHLVDWQELAENLA